MWYKGSPSTTEALKHDCNIQRRSSSVQLSNAFVSNMQTQKGEIALDVLGQDVKESSSRQNNIILRGRIGRTPRKRGLVSTPLFKTLQKATGTWERDYTHDFYPGHKFFPRAEGWSLSDRQHCTKQPGEPSAKSARACPDCYILLSC